MIKRVELEEQYLWMKMKQPDWSKLDIKPIDYQAISYFSAPKRKELSSLDEVDPELLETYNKLGIPLEEQKVLSSIPTNCCTNGN